jgi:hypothetical protein
MNEAALAVFVVIVFLIVFPLFWSGIVYLIARFGGWSDLAKHYAIQEPFSGTTFQMQSVTIGMLGNYRSVVTIGANYDGLYLNPLVVYRPGHPPLLIPWDDIETRDARGLSFGEMVSFSPRKTPKRTISISKKLADKLSNVSCREWPLGIAREGM